MTPGKASGRKNFAPKLFMMAKLKRGHCTVRSTVLAAPPAMVKDKSGEGGQTAINYSHYNCDVSGGGPKCNPHDWH